MSWLSVEGRLRGRIWSVVLILKWCQQNITVPLTHVRYWNGKMFLDRGGQSKNSPDNKPRPRKYLDSRDFRLQVIPLRTTCHWQAISSLHKLLIATSYTSQHWPVSPSTTWRVISILTTEDELGSCVTVVEGKVRISLLKLHTPSLYIFTELPTNCPVSSPFPGYLFSFQFSSWIG